MTIRRTLTTASLTTATLAALLAGCSGQPKAEAPKPAESSQNIQVDPNTQKQVGIEVQPAMADSLSSPVSATGQLALNEDQTWHVGAAIEGRIVAVPVHLGDAVKAGQVVAQMHSHEVHDSRAARRQAIAEMQRLKVLAEQAQRVLDRTKRLYELKAASREQLEAAETQARSAQLSVTNAQIEVDKTETHLVEFLEVDLADEKADGHGIGHDSKSDEADRVPIKTPASGIVMERNASAGTVVSVGDPVVTVSDLSSLWLIAAVNEADLSHVRIGQAVKITVRAYPDRIFPGKVFQLGEHMDPQTRTLQVRVLVANTQSLLKPEMFATADFAGQGERSIIHVPESAVQEIDGKTVVFVGTQTGSFTRREVKVGARVDRQVEILSGLEPGTPVVVNGAVLLKSQLLKGSE